MHRFRKKSDANRPSQLSDDELASNQPSPQTDPIPVLPAGDFRTSLILPSLSRRFTLLRRNGEPVSPEEMRSRLAAQRASGSPHRITKEEEDLVIAALTRISEEYRDREAANKLTATNRDDSASSTGSLTSGSQPSSPSLYPQSSSSDLPSGRSSKRHSNNLFGSGKLRDTNYLRAARTGSNRSLLSIASQGTGSNNSSSSQDFPTNEGRPITPENVSSVTSGSLGSTSPNEKTPVARTTHLPSASSTPPASVRQSNVFTSAQKKRASLALDEVLRSLEEENDEMIIAPYSPSREPKAIPSPITDFENTLSWLTERDDDRVRTSSPYRRPGTTSPPPRSESAARIPGYIPGMHRPISPRDIDSDDGQSRYSATPRATSPPVPLAAPPLMSERTPTMSPAIPPGILTSPRRGSNASTSRMPVRPESPSSTSVRSKSRNGNIEPSTPTEDRAKNASFASASPSEPSPILKSSTSVSDRRRPSSPLASLSFRPITGSRPGTPASASGNAWVNSSATSSRYTSQNEPKSPLVRSDSSTPGPGSRRGSVSETHADAHLLRQKSLTRSLASPALPDSPYIDGEPYAMNIQGVWEPREARPPSSISGVDLGRPILARSPTPNMARAPSVNGYHEDGRASVNGHRGQKFNHTPSSSSSSSVPQPQPAPFVLSSMLNSSESSLVSVGSSYHSWEDDDTKARARGFSILVEYENGPKPAWDEAVWGESPEHDVDPTHTLSAHETLLQTIVGLTKDDLATIQGKLVAAAISKKTNEARSPRKRRPSTSQSIGGRDTPAPAAPTPQPQPPLQQQIVPPPRISPDHTQKANALLNSVLHSIESTPAVPTPEATPVPQQAVPPPPPAQQQSNPPPSDPKISQQRAKALAEALFGSEESPDVTTSSSEPTSTLSTIIGTQDPDSSTLPSSTRAPSVAPQEESQLEQDVKRKATLATAALKNPSLPRLAEATRRKSTKRIDPQKIGSPQLVSASTSVDTIPLPSSSLAVAAAQLNESKPDPKVDSKQAPSKLSMRLKKLRGTLRTKLVPTGDEVTPYVEPASAPPGSQTAHYNPQNLNTPAILSVPALTSTTDLQGFQISPSSPAPSLQASTGPQAGLKGFMARLRKTKKDEADTDQSSRTLGRSNTTSQRGLPESFRSPSPYGNGNTSRTQLSSTPEVSAPSPAEARDIDRKPMSNPSPDEGALRQLYAAASDLGVDRDALNEFLSRSNSISTTLSTTNLTRSQSVSQPPRTLEQGRRSTDSSRPPVTPISPSPTPKLHGGVSRHLSARIAPAAEHARPSKEGSEGSNAVIRRTLIYSSESRPDRPPTAEGMARKPSQRRRTSASSARSLLDRAPTPPPSRAKRVSEDISPPVPQLPSSLTIPQLAVTPSSSGFSDKPTSTYESLYDMYSGELRHGKGQYPSEVPVSPSAASMTGASAMGEGRALEVLELANGEVIWTVVDGLRGSRTEDYGYDADDAFSSYYRSRTSLSSEYSTREPRTSSDGVQVSFKEHKRAPSKSSIGSSRKPGALGDPSRPETKIFYSSSANIERLIDQISRGLDSGSFNITPNTPSGDSFMSGPPRPPS